MGLIRISLEKPMGIIFQPGSEEAASSGEGVLIGELDARGAAALSKKLRVGDELLSVNDITVRNIPFDEVMKFILEAHGEMDLLFRRSEEMTQLMKEEYTYFQVTLRKPMGIVFENKIDRQNTAAGNTIRIGDITTKGSARRSGILRVGDELISVNGEEIHTFSFDDVMDYIVESEREVVKLNFRRVNKK